MRKVNENRKAQIFSLDVLITLIPILLILGASAQYVFNTQEAFRSAQQDIELSSVSRMILNRLVVMAEASGQRFDDIDVMGLAENLGGVDYNYYFLELHYDAGFERGCIGEDYWSTGLDEESPRFFRNTTGSWKRFVLAPNWDYRDSSGDSQYIANITELSLAVWK